MGLPSASLRLISAYSRLKVISPSDSSSRPRPAATELGTARKRLLPNTLKRLMNHAWPGNVRELENLSRWLTVMAPGQEIAPSDLPEAFVETAQTLQSESWPVELAKWVDEQLANDND